MQKKSCTSKEKSFFFISFLFFLPSFFLPVKTFLGSVAIKNRKYGNQFRILGKSFLRVFFFFHLSFIFLQILFNIAKINVFYVFHGNYS
jgi:hypothetical protein